MLQLMVIVHHFSARVLVWVFQQQKVNTYIGFRFSFVGTFLLFITLKKTFNNNVDTLKGSHSSPVGSSIFKRKWFPMFICVVIGRQKNVR